MSEFEQYRGLFVAESRENHENVVKNLLILEKGRDEDAINELFRSAHTLKGASASMGFADMERLCHAMEDVFQLVRNGTDVTKSLSDLLLSCTDMVEEMLDDIEGGGDGSGKNPEPLIAELHKISSGGVPAAKEKKESGAEPPGVTPASKEPTLEIPDDGSGLPRFRIRIKVADTCMMKDVRAMIVISQLDGLGKILSVTPSREDIDEGKFEGTADLVIESDYTQDELRAAASGSEIEQVDLTPMGGGAEDSDKGQKPVQKSADDRKAQQDKNREIKNLRVDIAQLDRMMNLVEDLVINRGRLKQIADRNKIKEMDEAINMVARSVGDLQNLMMGIRMIPLNHTFNRLPRVVRDTAQYDGKEVDFVMEGGETELDRSVMDGLNDPLLHLIRNAVNHGIEAPDVREKIGKPRKGQVRLSAHRDRDNVIIELIDDGAGINVAKVKSKAIEKGLITREAADALSDDQAIDLLFQPGFSTADKITDISGRGVGLDVVKRAIESMKGSIRVESTVGKGSRFELLLPPTMAIVDVMIVKINGKRCAIPITNIVEVANLKKDTIHHVGKTETILMRDEVLQLYWLDEMFGNSKSADILIVVQYQKRKCGLPVDIVEGQQEVVVKPLSSLIGSSRGINGVTILGDGDVVPVLDVNTMM
ncbi:MAG: chemotaxis protein CheA [Methanoregulaceae archaeon]